jgi:hypothetical protein
MWTTSPSCGRPLHVHRVHSYTKYLSVYFKSFKVYHMMDESFLKFHIHCLTCCKHKNWHTLIFLGGFFCCTKLTHETLVVTIKIVAYDFFLVDLFTKPHLCLYVCCFNDPCLLGNGYFPFS